MGCRGIARGAVGWLLPCALAVTMFASAPAGADPAMDAGSHVRTPASRPLAPPSVANPQTWLVPTLLLVAGLALYQGFRRPERRPASDRDRPTK